MQDLLSEKNVLKTEIKLYPETEQEANAIINAISNKDKLDNIYDEVFRPVIKYGQDEKKVEAFEMVWKQLGEYLYE